MTNKRLGDWGEDLVARSIPSDFVVVKYGRAGELVAGEPGFREFYNHYQDELDAFGKRPDLLIFKPQDYESANLNLSEADNEDIAEVVRKAVAAIEVRSSNYLSRRYRPGSSSPFQVLSFTIKVEDIAIVRNWVQNTGVPHYYAQVPFDEVYSIGFHTALDIASNSQNRGVKYALQKNTKNQFKTTVHIPFTEGRKIGDVSNDVSLEPVRQELNGGRLLFSVKFSGGTLTPMGEVWQGIFNEAERIKRDPPPLSSPAI